MTSIRTIKLLLLTLLLALSGLACAELSVPSFFSDHMVLQRDQKVKIWGKADADVSVTVTFDQKRYRTEADRDGNWHVWLPPQKAGGPWQLDISAGKTISIRDLYFGDVWLSGGQSNMEFKLNWKVNNYEAEIADSNYPLIRYFEVPHLKSATKQNDIDNASWVLASSQTSPNFSAIAWLFAKHLHQEKGVPVGIIDSNWGGTPAEAWVSPKSLLDLPAYREKTEKIYHGDKNWDKIFAENTRLGDENYARLSSEKLALAAGAYKFDVDTKGWATVDLPNREGEFTDLAWLRKDVMLDAGNAQTATLEFGDLVQEAFIFVNEKLIASEDWKMPTSTHTLAPGTLKKGRNVIAIRIGSSWNNKPIAGRAGMIYLQVDGKKIDLSKGWRYSNKVEAPLPEVVRYEWTPGFLYNAMIYPLSGYGMKGVIWYQGESNTDAAALYGDLFKTLIRDWRKSWQQDFPFLFVQLAGFQQYQYPQPDSQWALLRDMQASALSLPKTGMATAVDLGEQDNIHPRNKQDVALRLWLEAKRIAYGNNIVSQGPVVTSHQVKNGQVILQYQNIGDGLIVKPDAGSKEKNEISGFIIAGADGKYYPANAKLDGDKVIVRSDEVKAPKAIKFAWADFPIINLYNSVDLPALPFELKL